VEDSTDIYILRPIDRSVVFEINNGGANLSFRQFNDVTTPVNDPTTAGDAGNGFLMQCTQLSGRLRLLPNFELGGAYCKPLH